MTAKRYNPVDPAVQGREVVLSCDHDSILLELTTARATAKELEATNSRQAQQVAALESELATVRSLSVALDCDSSLDERMQASGMFSVAQILAGKPIDAFIHHAGVIDLRTFSEWLEMKRAQFVKMQARFELAGRENDDLYEWTFAHAAVFSEVMINFRHASLDAPPVLKPDGPDARKEPTRLH